MSTYTPLASITLASAQSSVTFSGYDMTYTDLVLVSSVTCATDSANQRMTVNGDSSSLYSTTRIAGNGSTATSGRYNGLAYFLLTGGAINPPSSASAQILITNFMNYSNTTTNKTILVRAGNASGSTYPGVEYNVELYRSTNAISSFTLSTDSANFNSGSTFSLYGIQAGTPKAQGGDIVTTDGTYWYHAFKSSGTFTPSSAITCDYLVVAGGGSGGSPGGGGAAGGFRAIASQSLVAQNYPVVIGAGGGVGGYNPRQYGGSGNNSIFNTFTSTGGGRAASGDYAAATGGSGGGGAATGWGGGYQSGAAGNTPSTSPVQGYAGGTGGSSTNYVGGGGGGASAVGANSSGTVAGAGGAGANSYNSITVTSWFTATNTGVSGYLAGGGGGGGITAAAGGSGGGGAGASGDNNGTSGTVNSGSGGGGARVNSGTVNTGASGGGGSGLVIIRYAV